MQDATGSKTPRGSQTIHCVHVGGPWDGAEEQRTLRGTQTALRIAQRVPTHDHEGALPFLLHDYAIVMDEETARLVYRGCRASATAP